MGNCFTFLQRGHEYDGVFCSRCGVRPCLALKERAIRDYLDSKDGRGGTIPDGTIPPFVGYLDLLDSTEINFS